VTKDVNVQLKARVVGLESQDYLNDKVPVADAEAREGAYREIPVTVHEMQRFCSEVFFDLGAGGFRSLALNDYVLLRSDAGKTMPARVVSADANGGSCVAGRLRIPESVRVPGGIPIRPRNLE
jgi:PhoH-like ATPase